MDCQKEVASDEVPIRGPALVGMSPLNFGDGFASQGACYRVSSDTWGLSAPSLLGGLLVFR